MAYNVFVLGLDDLNLMSLQRVPRADELTYHELLSIDELQHRDDIPVPELVEKATRALAAFDGDIDAIVGYWDFPVSCMLPILCERFGLPTTSLESRLKCEHKFWSRVEQAKVLDDNVTFQVVDPWDEHALDRLTLDFPFWLKPIKAFSSELAFKVTDGEVFTRALAQIREGVARVGEPFGWLLSQVELPPVIGSTPPTSCLAEETLTGHMATVEGYSLHGQIDIYGVVDSLRYPDSSTFLRYEYPSRLPDRVQACMADMSRRIIRQVGVDRSTFNIEFFWNEGTDLVRLLEVNTRHSQSHALLFEAVDGIPNHAFMVNLALGWPPPVLEGKGPHNCSAKWFLRRFEDALVTRSPTDEEVAALQEEIPGTVIDLEAREGMRLSEMHDQDAYSYRLANIFIGADDGDELTAKYDACVEGLQFEFAG